jgi:signal recognition particle subunit SRP54
MFDSLSEKLERAFKMLKGQGTITEVNVSETLKEIRRALIDADVNYKIAKDFADNVKQKALGQNVLTSVSPGQLLVKITHDELTQLMGNQESTISLQSNPTIILMSGLQGSGKTTFSAKLANYFKNKKGKKPLLVACDVYRPAAIQQLKTLGEQLGVEVFANENEKKPVNIAKDAIQHAKMNENTVVIIDTAGRLAVDEQMMNEIADIKKAINPDEILFVVDSMTGQDAVNTAKAFNDKLNFDGVVLTKLDGDTRGGAALSIRAVVNKPIKFVGTGEKPDAMDVFYPARMADRILGMGDIVTLVEKAQEHFDVEESKRLQRKIAKSQFDLNDFLKQLQQIKKMGNLKDIAGMLPGMGSAVKDAEIDEKSFKHIEAVIQSMTSEERAAPHIINGNRKKRIASGSGTNIQEVNRLLKQFDDMNKMMKMMNNKHAMAGMMKAMGKMPFGGK